MVEAANPAFFATVGADRTRTGVPLADLLPEPADQGFFALLDRVCTTGEP